MARSSHDAHDEAPAPGGGAAARRALPLLSSPQMRYQTEYVWLVFFASLDIMLTWAILKRDGEEVNPLARLVINMWDLQGAIAFKFALMLFVIVSCEVVGRRADRTGTALARVAIAISAAPVLYSLVLLIDHMLLRPPT